MINTTTNFNASQTDNNSTKTKEREFTEDNLVEIPLTPEQLKPKLTKGQRRRCNIISRKVATFAAKWWSQQLLEDGHDYTLVSVFRANLEKEIFRRLRKDGYCMMINASDIQDGILSKACCNSSISYDDIPGENITMMMEYGYGTIVICRTGDFIMSVSVEDQIEVHTEEE